MPSKIAVLYRDEQSLQYFFVCCFCDACYETRSEIIAHVNVRCHKNVNGEIDKEQTIQSERPCCYENNENITTTEADLNLNFIEDKATLEFLKCETNSSNEVIDDLSCHEITVDKRDEEFPAKDSIIDILDSGGDDGLQEPPQECVQRSSVTSFGPRNSSIIDISDDEVIVKAEIPETTNFLVEMIKNPAEELRTMLLSGRLEADWNQSNLM